MTTQIRVLRDNLIKELSGLSEDNVGIAGIEFPRKKLLAALKLQKDADFMTITYGLMSWHYDYEHKHPESGWLCKDGTIRNWESAGSVKVDYPARWEYKPYDKEPTPCIQFTMESSGYRQTMRFCHAPVTTKAGEGKTKHLNFIDSANPVPKPELTGIALDTAMLIRALEFTVKSAAIEESRPVLCSVLFDCGNDVIKFVSADGFRLATATVIATGIATNKILIDRKEIYTLIKFLKGTIQGRGKGRYYPDVYLSRNQDNNEVYFATESGRITLNHCMGDFPNYSQLIPKEGTKIEFIASDLLNVIKPLTGIVSEGSGIIRLEFKAGSNDFNLASQQYDNIIGKITVSAHSEEHESSNEVNAKVESDCRIALNYRYLTDVLSHMGNDVVTLMLTNPSSPMVFTDNDLQETIMPMFVNWTSELKPDNQQVPEPVWQMTKEEYRIAQGNPPDPAIIDKWHREVVQEAIFAGNIIPPEVLAEYPELIPEDMPEPIEPEITEADNEYLNEHDRQTVEV